MRSAILAGLVLACVGCGGPREGEPCAPGDRGIFVGYDGVGLFPLEVYLLCSFPPGCDPAPEHGRWARHVVLNSRHPFELCGCDGTTLVAGYDFFVPRPWRWLGTCEEPCASVRYDADEGRLAYFNASNEAYYVPVAPECTCADVDPARCSVDSRGRAIPAACCDACLAESALGLDGVCRHPELEIPQACCAGCAEAEGSPFPDFCTVPLAGETSGSCCACGYAVFDAAGRCIDEAGGRQVSRACCDCASTTVDPLASWCDDCANAERRADGGCLHAMFGQPIDAACCDCARAVRAADGSCAGSAWTSSEVAPECCDCENAQPHPDGGCVDSTSGLEIADFCCAP